MNDETVQAVADQTEQLVVFELAGELYGVNISTVKTIVRMQEITNIPRTPDFVEGVINLRGSIIPVIDLRKRFALPIGENTKASRIVVVLAVDQTIGMVVDAVAETLKLHADAIEPPSPVVASIDSEFLRGVGKDGDRLVVLLDLDKILDARQFETLAKVESRAKQAAEKQAKAA